MALSYHWGSCSLELSSRLALPRVSLARTGSQANSQWGTLEQWAFLQAHGCVQGSCVREKREWIGRAGGNQRGPLQWLTRCFMSWLLPTSLASSFATHLLVFDHPALSFVSLSMLWTHLYIENFKVCCTPMPTPSTYLQDSSYLLPYYFSWKFFPHSQGWVRGHSSKLPLHLCLFH